MARPNPGVNVSSFGPLIVRGPNIPMRHMNKEEKAAHGTRNKEENKLIKRG